jgi:hypothetical protein
MKRKNKEWKIRRRGVWNREKRLIRGGYGGKIGEKRQRSKEREE